MVDSPYYGSTYGIGTGGRESPSLHNVSMQNSMWRHLNNALEEQTPLGVNQLSTRHA